MKKKKKPNGLEQNQTVSEKTKGLFSKPKKPDNDNDDDDDNILYDKNLQEIFNAYENNIGCITPMIADTLRSYSEDGLSSSLIIHSFRIAVERNNRNLKYIRGILNNWQKRNLKSVLDVENYEKQRQAQMHPKEETEKEKFDRRLKDLEEATKDDTE